MQLRLDTRNVPGWAKADVDRYRAGTPNASEPLFRGVALPREYAMELAPFGAVFFVIRPAGRAAVIRRGATPRRDSDRIGSARGWLNTYGFRYTRNQGEMA